MTSLDATTFDRTVRPQDDLFRYVNGPWLREAQIPEDKALIGAFVVLRDRAEEAVREIVTEEPGEDPDPIRAKIADLYASYMDEQRLEQLGAQRPVLGLEVEERDGGRGHRRRRRAS